MKKILIISNPEDEHTKHVVSRIIDLGGDPFLFYPERLSLELSITLTHSDIGKQHNTYILGAKEFERNFNDFYSIWYRRPRLVSFHADDLSFEEIEFAREEWRALIEATYALMNNSIWVSHPDKLREAARKPLQMLIAQQIGLQIPRTIITNDPKKAKQFYQECNGKVICKATGNGWVYSQDGKNIKYVLTNRVNEDDLIVDKGINLAPVTFQEEIVKMYELRVNVVGQEVLTIKIDSQQSQISQLDWRRYDVQNTPYTEYDLPLNIKENCLKLTKMLGLEFGAIDIIRDQNGNYVFLEINGNGQFLWAEELSGVKVSDSLARLLTGIVKPLGSVNFA